MNKNRRSTRLSLMAAALGMLGGSGMPSIEEGYTGIGRGSKYIPAGPRCNVRMPEISKEERERIRGAYPPSKVKKMSPDPRSIRSIKKAHGGIHSSFARELQKDLHDNNKSA